MRSRQTVLIKEQHLSATHIMCGYRLFESDMISLQNYSDDGEHGGSRRILDVLKQSGVFNVAIFVVRYYGSKNVGKARFDAITELAEKMLGAIPSPDRGERSGEPETFKALQQAVGITHKMQGNQESVD